MDDFLRGLPKAELHLHVEGTLEPERMFALARKNGVSLRFGSVEEVRRAYRFRDLQFFLDIYYEGARVLVAEQDFFELTAAYLDRTAADGVRHAEVFFDPQIHTARGIPFETVVRGIHRALAEGETRLAAGAANGVSPLQRPARRLSLAREAQPEGAPAARPLRHDQLGRSGVFRRLRGRELPRRGGGARPLARRDRPAREELLRGRASSPRTRSCGG